MKQLRQNKDSVAGTLRYFRILQSPSDSIECWAGGYSIDFGVLTLVDLQGINYRSFAPTQWFLIYEIQEMSQAAIKEEVE